jgi:uncharacterized GH25 family protein
MSKVDNMFAVKVIKISQPLRQAAIETVYFRTLQEEDGAAVNSGEQYKIGSI